MLKNSITQPTFNSIHRKNLSQLENSINKSAYRVNRKSMDNIDYDKIYNSTLKSIKATHDLNIYEPKDYIDSVLGNSVMIVRSSSKALKTPILTEKFLAINKEPFYKEKDTREYKNLANYTPDKSKRKSLAQNSILKKIQTIYFLEI